MVASRARFIGLSFALSLTLTQTAVAAEDIACMQGAVTRRQTELKTAYTEYSKTMIEAVTRLTTDENKALKQTDANFRNNDTSSGLNNFGYSVQTNWQQLSVRLFQIWNDYYRERYQCGFSSTPPPAYGGYNNGYDYGYNNRCQQPVLAAPPAGCSYECANDSNGCQRCHVTCRTPVSYSRCGCPPISSPVCSRDNRTYDNACLAICDGREVWHVGVCY